MSNSIFNNPPEDQENENMENEANTMSDMSDLLSALLDMKTNMNDDADDSDTAFTNKDADDYHNEACDHARNNRFKQAVALCQTGLQFFPQNVDLLADIIKYAASYGDMETALSHFERLKTVPLPLWNWRAYTFAFDLLLQQDPFGNEAECRELICHYRHFFPYEEKAALAEAELETALGHHEEAIEVLVNAIRTRKNACQCALMLADKQMDRGLYTEVIETTNYALSASFEVQPSINRAYILLLQTLAKSSLLCGKISTGEAVGEAEIEKLIGAFNSMLEDDPAHYIRYRSAIRDHILVLRYLRRLA